MNPAGIPYTFCESRSCRWTFPRLVHNWWCRWHRGPSWGALSGWLLGRSGGGSAAQSLQVRGLGRPLSGSGSVLMALPRLRLRM